MNRIVARLFAALTVLAVLVGAAVPVRAQDYPTRPVKIIIAFPVGGLLDVVSRIVGEKLSGLTGQQFVIEARPGAGGTLATSAVARAEPDGYTLMMINDNHAINPSVFKSIPYDSVKDFAPIGFVGSAPLVFSVHAGLPLRSVKDLVAMAREKPGIVTYGSVGVGSAAHLAGEMFTSAANVTMQHVPYRGGAPALNDLVAGHLNTQMLSAVVALPHIEAGKLRPLAVAHSARLDVLPDVPTLAEAGYPLEAAYWFGLVAPAGTPAPVIAKLEKALGEVLAMADVKKRLTDMGAVVNPLGARDFAAYIRTDMAKWADVITKNNIKFE
ncbi:MAG: Bug family tripartite tricarboxylate transporter substrate binding protein [Xanthobacteraceae bacterium]|jgi:tripartite-type tricarboxylate transporter receptor subunit TctC